MQDNKTTDAAPCPFQSGKVRCEIRPSGVAVIYLGSPQEEIITLTIERLRSLDAALTALLSEPPRGLILMAAAPGMFTVGADIKLMQSFKDPCEAERCAREGQSLFNRVAALPFSTVAAISGPCIGGGCELALCCKHRIISDHEKSRIGLPEIRIGIIPACGGTQRLPRLIGIQSAADLILNGRTPGPSQARALGLVDDVLPYEMLLSHAEELALNGSKYRRPGAGMSAALLTHLTPLRNLIVRRINKQLEKKAGTFYPAPAAALECIAFGLQHGPAAGMDLEAARLGKLIFTPAAKNLMRLFFMTRAAKAIGRSAANRVKCPRVLVAGAGRVGQSAAAALAKEGCEVILKDENQSLLRQAMDAIEAALKSDPYLSGAQRSFILNRIEPTTRNNVSLAHTAFVIDALPEELEAKQRALRELGKLAAPDALLLSSCASFTITKISAALEHPERAAGMHFFSPLWKTQAVEIVRGPKTSDRSIVLAAALAVKAGKYPIIVNDAPGFLLLRCLAPSMVEALNLLGEGRSPGEIDGGAASFGMRFGPLEIMDEMGLDLTLKIFASLAAAYGERMRPEFEVSRLIERGWLGRRTGIGFYHYRKHGRAPNLHLRDLRRAANLPAPSPEDLQTRLILPMISEAVRCLDEGIAGHPGREAAQQIDLGSVTGLGFPACKGGLLWYAQELGLKYLLDEFGKFGGNAGAGFAAPDGIRRRVEAGKGFYD